MFVSFHSWLQQQGVPSTAGMPDIAHARIQLDLTMILGPARAPAFSQHLSYWWITLFSVQACQLCSPLPSHLYLLPSLPWVLDESSRNPDPSGISLALNRDPSPTVESHNRRKSQNHMQWQVSIAGSQAFPTLGMQKFQGELRESTAL